MLDCVIKNICKYLLLLLLLTVSDLFQVSQGGQRCQSCGLTQRRDFSGEALVAVGFWRPWKKDCMFWPKQNDLKQIELGNAVLTLICDWYISTKPISVQPQKHVLLLFGVEDVDPFFVFNSIVNLSLN